MKAIPHLRISPGFTACATLVCLLILMSGCAPRYQKAGKFDYGYRDIKLQEDMFKISYDGNSYMSKRQAEDFATLRAAEVVLDNGYAYFVILESEIELKEELRTTEAVSRTKIETDDPGDVEIETRGRPSELQTRMYPQVTLLVQCFNQEPQRASGRIYEARFVKQSIRSTYELE